MLKFTLDLSPEDMKKIVLLDDHHGIYLNIKMIFEMLDHKVNIIYCSDKNQASTAIRTNAPDLVISDINLGKELDLAIPKMCQKSNIPCVIYSGYHHNTVIKEAMALGVKGFISKAAPIDEILNGFSAILRNETFFCSIAKANLKLESSQLTNLSKPTFTQREREIMETLKLGLPDKDIASKLQCSIESIRKHRYNMKNKNHCISFEELLSRYNFWYPEV